MGKRTAAQKSLKCIVCGKELSGLMTRYCGRECYRRFYLRPVTSLGEAKCPICGSIFGKRRPNQVYCSKKCVYLRKNMAAVSLRKQRDRTRRQDTEKSEMILCNMCGNPFRSWDRTRNRRCLRCQREVENLCRGSDIRLLEGITD